MMALKGRDRNACRHHNSVVRSVFIFLSPQHKPWSNINSGHFLHKHPQNPVRDLAQFRGCEDKEVARREELSCCIVSSGPTPSQVQFNNNRFDTTVIANGGRSKRHNIGTFFSTKYIFHFSISVF